MNLPLTVQVLKDLEQALEVTVTVEYYADQKDWGNIEKFLDYVDVCYESNLYLHSLVISTATYRNKLNNWYVFRDEVVEEFKYRNVSPQTIHHIRLIQ